MPPISPTGSTPSNTYATRLGDGQLFALARKTEQNESATKQNKPKAAQAQKPNGRHLEEAFNNFSVGTALLTVTAFGATEMTNPAIPFKKAWTELGNAYNEAFPNK
jgi:hypothetical protein